jgi:hypothetical protein
MTESGVQFAVFYLGYGFGTVENGWVVERLVRCSVVFVDS